MIDYSLTSSIRNQANQEHRSSYMKKSWLPWRCPSRGSWRWLLSYFTCLSFTSLSKLPFMSICDNSIYVLHCEVNVVKTLMQVIVIGCPWRLSVVYLKFSLITSDDSLVIRPSNIDNWIGDSTVNLTTSRLKKNQWCMSRWNWQHTSTIREGL